MVKNLKACRTASRYFKLLYLFVKCSLMNSLEYRFNFFFGGLFEITWLIMNVIFFRVIFMNTGLVAGWNMNQVLLLVFFCGLVDGVITFWVNSGCGDIPFLINQGTLDFVLLKPVNARFYLSFRRQAIPQVYNMIFNIAAIIYISVTSNMNIGFKKLIMAIVLGLNGMFVIYTFLFTLMTVSFWVVKMDIVFNMTQELFTIGNKPINIYPRLLQKFFTYIIPLAIAFSYPVMYYTRELKLLDIIIAFAVSIIFFCISQIVFKIGLQKYSSASS